jgi:hypothetical protein
MDTSGVYDNFVTVSATDSAGNVGTCTLPRLVVYDPLTCATTESLSLAGYLGDTVSTIFQVQGGPTGTQVSAVSLDPKPVLLCAITVLTFTILFKGHIGN